jgi:hypothetical protein
MHKDEAGMKKAVKFVRYEWRQFSWAASIIFSDSKKSD